MLVPISSVSGGYRASVVRQFIESWQSKYIKAKDTMFPKDLSRDGRTKKGELLVKAKKKSRCTHHRAAGKNDHLTAWATEFVRLVHRISSELKCVRCLIVCDAIERNRDRDGGGQEQRSLLTSIDRATLIYIPQFVYPHYFIERASSWDPLDSLQ